MRISDWSSDVCSSDLYAQDQPRFRVEATLVDAADADQLAVRLRVQPETGIADRPLERLAHRPVPDLNRDHPRLRHADACDLVERHHAAVGIDMARLQQAGRGTTGPQTRALRLQHRHRTVTAPIDGLHNDVRLGPSYLIITH